MAKKDLGIYIEPETPIDEDFDATATALDILHSELSERDETLAKLRAMGVQLAAMSSRNALDIAAIKRLLRGLSKTGQFDIEAAEKEEGISFIDFLGALPSEKQTAILERIIDIARKSRTQEEFDAGMEKLAPAIEDMASQVSPEADEATSFFEAPDELDKGE